MTQIGIDTTLVYDGKQALDQLQTQVNDGLDINQHIALIISDIEMPEMDGSGLTTEIRKDAVLKIHSRITRLIDERRIQHPTRR